MANSIFKKLNRDVLLRYDYGSTSIAEPYKVLFNIKDGETAFISGDTSITNNITSNQLFVIDPVQNKYAVVNTTLYSFLTLTDYFQSGMEYDTINIFLPSNFTFGQYIGFYIRVYTYDYNNISLYELSNFYFDLTNTNQNGLLQSITPPLFYENIIWDKSIQITIPSIYNLGLQSDNGTAISGSVNYNLTNGVGLSQTSPIFIDFQFLTGTQVVGTLQNYLTTIPFTVELPQIPTLDTLILVIQESNCGDYFEIFLTYNGTIDNFVSFVESASQNNINYICEYLVTIYEQNIFNTSN